ncbi:MAG: hypothetical protein AAGJ89_01760 [Pseudomonadota bacterium]
MHGVILWGDQDCERPLIWCEDHGSLAFYKAPTISNSVPLDFDAGDLVFFDVQDGDDLRLALNLSVVASEEYPFLVSKLRQAMSDGRAALNETRHTQSTVVSLSEHSYSRCTGLEDEEKVFNIR